MVFLIIRARSSSLVSDDLMPTCALAARKPFGYVPDVGIYFRFEDDNAPKSMGTI